MDALRRSLAAKLQPLDGHLLHQHRRCPSRCWAWFGGLVGAVGGVGAAVVPALLLVPPLQKGPNQSVFWRLG